MTDADDDRDAHVLVLLELPLESAFPEALAEVLVGSEVFVLACRSIPDQTSPEQAHDAFDEESQEALDEVIETFERTGSPVDSKIVYTSDVPETARQYADALEVDALLYDQPVERVERVLAVGTESIDFDRFVTCLTSLGQTPLAKLKLLQIGSDDDDLDEQNLVLEGIERRLVDRGVAEDIVATETIVPADQTEEVFDQARGFDLVVIADRRPTLGDRIAGTLAERVRDQTERPVLLVRAPEG